MNKERLETLAAIIEKLPHVIDYGTKEDVDKPAFSAFNMNAWQCGSVACIGGWAQHLWVPDAHPADAIDYEVANALGISIMQAAQLFFPDISDYRAVTPAQAAAVIRNLIATGEVDWNFKDTVEGIDL